MSILVVLKYWICQLRRYRKIMPPLLDLLEVEIILLVIMQFSYLIPTILARDKQVAIKDLMKKIC